jgi:hypothetical protein
MGVDPHLPLQTGLLLKCRSSQAQRGVLKPDPGAVCQIDAIADTTKAMGLISPDAFGLLGPWKGSSRLIGW